MRARKPLIKSSSLGTKGGKSQHLVGAPDLWRLGTRRATFDQRFPRRQRSRRAFTLVELLIVVAVVALLLGLTVYSFGTLGAISTAGALSEVENLLVEAREEALVSNKAIQIRIYQTPDELDPTQATARRVVAGRVVPVTDPTEAGYGNPAAYDFEPIGQSVELPAGTAFHRGIGFSSLIDGHSPNTDGDIVTGTETQPGSVSPTLFSAFTFSPDLGVALDPAKEWTLTVVESRNPAATGLPDNYAILRLLPRTGRVLLTRP